MTIQQDVAADHAAQPASPAPPAHATRPVLGGADVIPPPGAASSRGYLRPASDCGCGGNDGHCACDSGGGTTGYVYAIGTVTARFPSLSIEKEFMQAWGKSPTATLNIRDSDRFEVLSQGENLYLAREMCWVFQCGDIDVYILEPRSYVELTDLVSCLSPTPGLVSYALIIGRLGNVAQPHVCNGIQLPVVGCDQVFSFTNQAFINSIVAAVRSSGHDGTDGTDGAPADLEGPARNAFSVMTLLTDNTGQTDEHRAINYLTFKSIMLYQKEIEMEAAGFRLNAVTAHPDSLSRTRSVQDVVLTYANSTSTEIRRFFTRVDVTGEYPFLLNELAPFYDHP